MFFSQKNVCFACLDVDIFIVPPIPGLYKAATAPSFSLQCLLDGSSNLARGYCFLKSFENPSGTPFSTNVKNTYIVQNDPKWHKGPTPQTLSQNIYLSIRLAPPKKTNKMKNLYRTYSRHHLKLIYFILLWGDPPRFWTFLETSMRDHPLCHGGPILYVPAGPSAISRRALPLFPGGPFRYFPAGPSAISQRALPLFPGGPFRYFPAAPPGAAAPRRGPAATPRRGPAAAPRRPRGRARPVRILNCGRARLAF